MGNRTVCEALRALSYDASLQLNLTHLVLAAPDIDAGRCWRPGWTLRKGNEIAQHAIRDTRAISTQLLSDRPMTKA
jgi:esterase/lipase superfamily enzyme